MCKRVRPNPAQQECQQPVLINAERHPAADKVLSWRALALAEADAEGDQANHGQVDGKAREALQAEQATERAQDERRDCPECRQLVLWQWRGAELSFSKSVSQGK